MDIQEIRAKKTDVEVKVSELLTAFLHETGLSIIDIEIEPFKFPDPYHIGHSKLISWKVNIKVEL